MNDGLSLIDEYLLLDNCVRCFTPVGATACKGAASTAAALEPGHCMSGGGKSGLHHRPGKQQQGNGKQQQQQQSMLPPKMPKKRQSGKRSTSLPVLVGCGLCALVVVLGLQWYMTALPEPAGATLTRPPKKQKPAKVKRDIFGVPESKPELESDPKKRESLEWTTLPRDYDGCLEQQQELMTIPVPWPGFHAMCIESVSTAGLAVTLHNRSGDATRSVESGTRLLHVAAETESELVDALVGRLKDELLHLEFQRVDS